MRRRISHANRAETHKIVVQLFSFLCVGGFGAVVNLLCFSGVYYPLLEVTNRFLAYGISFVVATEVSIVSNFILNDRLTFGDLHARCWQAAALIIATAWNFVFHHLFTYRHVAVRTPAITANTGRTTL